MTYVSYIHINWLWQQKLEVLKMFSFLIGWDHYHDTIESYDPALDKWDIVGEMGSSRSWLSCVGLTVKMESGTTGEEKS